MASRRRSEQFDPLSRKAEDKATLENVTEGIFGSGQSGVPVRETIKLIALDQIQPDPAQPRRVAPSAIRGMGIADMGELFSSWMQAANKENAGRHYADLEWDKLLNLDEDLEEEKFTAKDYGPIAAALIKVALLSRSIKKDGLINPITVARSGRDYLIETGERRWWAYNLLALFDGEYRKIPAREVEKRDLWRQAVENMSREELSAIGRARQFAILLMDLYRKGGVEFLPYAALVKDGCDRLFYAQVADGSKFKIPKGKADLICGAMGINSPEYLRQIRAMLRVDDDIWVEADDCNYSWDWILDTDRLRRQWKKEDHTVRHLTVSTESEAAPSGEIEVLTMDGSTLIAPLDNYQPAADSSFGKYPLKNQANHSVRIGLQDDFLVFAIVFGFTPIHPWAALTPYDVGKHGLEDAVQRFRDGDLGENAKDDAAGSHTIEVLTIDGTITVGLQADWNPTALPWGVYASHLQQDMTSRRDTQVHVGAHDNVLVWRYFSETYPRQTGSWQPVKPHLMQDRWISAAVERFRKGDLGDQARQGTAERLAQPVGAALVPPAKFRVGDKVRSAYSNALHRVDSLRWNQDGKCWMYRLDDESQVAETNLSPADQPAAPGNAKPRGGEPVFVMGSGWVEQAAPASPSPAPDDTPAPKYQAGQRVLVGGQEREIAVVHRQGDKLPFYQFVSGGGAQENFIEGLAAPDAEEGNLDLDRAETVLDNVLTLSEFIRLKINSLLSISDEDISLLEQITSGALLHLQQEIAALNDALGDGLNHSAKLMDYVKARIEDKQQQIDAWNADLAREANKAAGREE